MANEWDEAYARSEKLRSLSKVLVDGVPIDPYAVSIEGEGQGDKEIKLVVSKELLILELDEIEVSLGGKTLPDVVRQLYEEDRTGARRFLLYHAGAHPRKATRNWFGFYQARPVKVKVSKEWLWLTVTEVTEMADLIIVRGTCRRMEKSNEYSA